MNPEQPASAIDHPLEPAADATGEPDFADASWPGAPQPGTGPGIVGGLRRFLGHQPSVAEPFDFDPAGIDPSAFGPDPEADPLDTVTTRLSVPEGATCRQCGGRISPDGYCERCGARGLSEREYFEQRPTPWLAGVCDKGLVHTRNEDAFALRAQQEPFRWAVLVVCDGVSSSIGSDVATLAAAEAACQALVRLPLEGERAEAVSTEAIWLANQAVIELTAPDSPNPASCTYAAAVVCPEVIWVSSVGDSRVYWFGDDGSAELLTVDDSLAQEQIAGGQDRATAEHSPVAHTITRWLGLEAPDLDPHLQRFTPTGDGWLLVCSDGLWNYASDPQALAGRVATFTGRTSDPLDLARSLTGWANEQGGQDNITVALARWQLTWRTASTAPVDDGSGTPAVPPASEAQEV